MAAGSRIVLASGCFDLFHPGHLAYLEAARYYGDELVVSVSSDDMVRAQKGPRRPIFPLAERLAIIDGLKIVSRVVVNVTPDQLAAIRRVKPNTYVKGWDYANGDPSGRLDLERLEVEQLGGQLVIVDPWPRYSSTTLMKALA